MLCAAGRRHHWAGAERLSLKTFRHGYALYDIGSGRYRVDEDGYLIVNEGEPYQITVDSAAPVESFCIFFDPGLAEDVRRTMVSPDDRLLDDPNVRATRCDSSSAFIRTTISSRPCSNAFARRQFTAARIADGSTSVRASSPRRC